MSGLEVVGVVLGALPLIISAFEHAQSLAKKWNLLTNFNSEHLKVWNDVKDEELMYRLQLQTLLAPLVLDGDLTKDRLETLLLSPQSNEWREADLDAALRKRLGEAYDRYLRGGHNNNIVRSKSILLYCEVGPILLYCIGLSNILSILLQYAKHFQSFEFMRSFYGKH
jgi:hypothetical protein